jgi:hypothetical protein
MNPDTKKAMIVAGAVVGLLVLTLALGVALGARGCGSKLINTPVTGIDAGPGDHAIDQRLDATVQGEEARIRELEAAHAQELRAMADAERQDYEAARARGRDSLAQWFEQRTARLLADGGPLAVW